jgi:hypothetical protein
MDSLSPPKIDNFNAVVTECTDKQARASRIKREVVQSARHTGYGDRLLELKRRRRLSRDRADCTK